MLMTVGLGRGELLPQAWNLGEYEVGNHLPVELVDAVDRELLVGSEASPRSKRWRYYVSQAALQGDKVKAGSIIRVPAPALEALVAGAVGNQSPGRASAQTDLRKLIDRVTIGRTTPRAATSAKPM